MPATEGGGRPSCLIALPCSAAPDPAELADLAARGADLFELRLDLSAIATADEAAAAAQGFAGHRLIATCRSEREGGRPRPDAERLALLRACAPHAAAIDIELSSTEIFDAVADRLPP
ncbi:MAG: type I 3-dehydroquinate dehydratase [Betaproteobacteria bacterium AqS2]|uniref:Type I 3-dehydroquinate dehydratase n=1 Tax=Candidatus Amphirhobacter heronislandensis TaxID=1732024 RepID=A0A930XVZ2_9GAMM|nr:type I 3-dehydroquinate dehydratase [Betaproteobacteria bacterium AqS2]